MLTYVPAAHVVHAAQLAAFVVVENVPEAHAAHVRSAVVEPALTSYCPALQLVFDTHAVAEFPSWSHALLAHVVLGVVPPGQNVPAAQLRHEAGAVAVAGEVCSVPAAHAEAERQEVWFGALA